MKTRRIGQTASLAVLVLLMAGCSTARYEPYPRPRTSVSLILNAGPGMMISRYPDGRIYYRNPQGWIYWRGYDNRYYLDRKYVQRSYHRYPQYNDWKRYHGRRR